MSSWFRLAPAIAIPLAGALAFSAAPPASAMTSYASPAILKSAGATSARPVAYYYHHWRRHYGYGGGAAFAATAFGMIAALAATSSYDCEWGACDDYGYGYGGPYYGYGGPYYGYGGPYYGGWGGHRHWEHWGGRMWNGGDHHAFAYRGGGRPQWLRGSHR